MSKKYSNFAAIMERPSFIINKKLLLLLIASTVLCSCYSLKNYSYESEDCQEVPREAIDIAIKDYSKRLRSRKNASITAVNIRSVCTLTDWFYLAMLPWIDDADRFPLSELRKNIGEVPPSWIPTDYVEKGKVLYVWHNPKKALSEEIIEKLTQYNLVLGEDEDWIVTLDGSHTCYIFCKYDYKKRYYRRVVVSYGTPLPTCGCH